MVGNGMTVIHVSLDKAEKTKLETMVNSGDAANINEAIIKKINEAHSKL